MRGLKKTGKSLAWFALSVFATGLPSPTATAKETIVLMWRDWAPMETKALKNVAAAFEKRHGVAVRFVMSGLNDGDSKLYSMFASGIAPDLFTNVMRSGIVDYAMRNFCADLTPFVKRDKINLNSFYPKTMEHMYRNGKLMGIPDHGGISCLWYNDQLFQRYGVKPPPADWDDASWTWDAMVETAKKLTRDVNGDGKPDLWGINLSDMWPVTCMAWFWGGDFFPPSIYDSGIAKESTATSQAAIKGIQELADLVIKHKVAGPYDGFVNSKVAMHGGGSWSLVNILYQKNIAVKPTVAVLPKGSAPRKPILYTNPWQISKSSKHKDAAWKWIKFCTLDEGADILTSQFPLPTISKRGVAGHMKQFADVQNYKTVFEGALAIGQESPNHTIANFGELLTAVETEANKVIAGRLPATDAMKNLKPRLDSILARTYSTLKQRQ